MTDWKELDDSLDDLTPERPRRSRRGLVLFGVGSLAVIGGVLAVVYGLPRLGAWMIERAHATHIACSNSDFDGTPGASLACAGEFQGDLTWAARVPATRADARTSELEWRADELEGRLELATEVLLDRELQASTADELVEWVSQSGFPADRRTTDWAFAVIANGGDRVSVVRHAALADDAFGRGRAMRAAIALGDVAAATAVARIGPTEEYGHEHDMRRGAWLCLVGEREAGLAALAAADEEHEARIHAVYTEAQLGIVACGGEGRGVENYGRELMWATEALVGAQAVFSIAHLDPSRPVTSQARSVTSPLFAAWIAEGKPTPEDIVMYSATMSLHLAQGTTPWGFGGPIGDSMFSSTPLVLDARRHEAAAEKLDSMRVAIETRKLRVRPIREGDAEDVRWSYDPDVRGARNQPAKTLRTAATRLWLDAASAYAEAFDRDGLHRAIARVPADELRGPVALFVASYMFRVGDRDAARQWLQTALEMPASRAKVDAELFLAMLELAEGRPREAVAAARRARAITGAAEGELRDHRLAEALGDSVTATMHRQIGWVEAAAALAAGESKVETKVALPTVYEGHGLPTDWFALALADEAKRRNTRFRMFALDAMDHAVLPAVVYVLHEVAKDGVDPEVFVDSALPLHDEDVNGIIGLRARAEAARMRGDTAATKRWDDRADALQALITSPTQVLLARLAGVM